METTAAQYLPAYNGEQIKKFAFMSGLPRSGSTLLSSILNQNPEIHSGANSPMCGMVYNLYVSMIGSEQWNAYPKPDVLQPMVYGLLGSFYSDIETPVVIDKSREWTVPSHFEVLKTILPYQPKVIMVVRPVIEILASFINLVHLNSGTVSFIDREIEARQEFHFYKHPDEIRCDSLMRPKGPLDTALFGVAYATTPEMRQYVHFVEYNDIVINPQKTIEKIYDFLGIDYFQHDFENIVNTTHENDQVYGLNGMHDVRKTVSRRMLDPYAVLPQSVIRKYSNMEVWRNA